VRYTGILIIGAGPWGTHSCQFYQEKQDLIDVLVRYFKAGLVANHAFALIKRAGEWHVIQNSERKRVAASFWARKHTAP
jgi:hypothetical protein